MRVLQRTFGSIKDFLKLGVGFTRARNGASNMHAVTCLPAMTGSWKYEGGGAHFANFDVGLNTNTAHASGVENKSKDRLINLVLTISGDDTSIKSGPPVKAILIQMQTPPSLHRTQRKYSEACREKIYLFVCTNTSNGNRAVC